MLLCHHGPPGPRLDPGPGGTSVGQQCVFFDCCRNGRIGVVFIYGGYLACGYDFFVCLLSLLVLEIYCCCEHWLVGHLLCYGLCNRR